MSCICIRQFGVDDGGDEVVLAALPFFHHLLLRVSPKFPFPAFATWSAAPAFATLILASFSSAVAFAFANALFSSAFAFASAFASASAFAFLLFVRMVLMLPLAGKLAALEVVMAS